MFCTVLHSLQSPTNVGIVVRTHVAFGGAELVFVGHPEPWSFEKPSQDFSRKLERLCKLVFLSREEDYLHWAADHGYQTVALEIRPSTPPVQGFGWPRRTALVLGNESRGLPSTFLAACHSAVHIPHHGPVGSLNVATAAAIAMHELRRSSTSERSIVEQVRGRAPGSPPPRERTRRPDPRPHTSAPAGW